jgi:hypothetical protein
VQGVVEGTLIGPLTPDEEKVFRDATVLFVGAVLSVLGDNLVDAYLHIRDGKELWDALEAKFGVVMPVANCMLWSSSMTTRWLKTLSSAFMERAKCPTLGPPGPERR